MRPGEPLVFLEVVRPPGVDGARIPNLDLGPLEIDPELDRVRADVYGRCQKLGEGQLEILEVAWSRCAVRAPANIRAVSARAGSVGRESSRISFRGGGFIRRPRR